ncbi:MAG: GNAT family N-acetyltransferase [Bacteroidaceae bacterium]|nr:GNAT family N-acetyltransferase [Bacteroidaceae bacterium]
MNFVFDNANQNDIDELIRLRLAFITEDAGSLSSLQEQCIEEQLRDYFNRKLRKELIAFVARDEKCIIAVAYLLLMEMPANARLQNGLYGEVLNVYTLPEFRGKGLCTTLMQHLIEYGKKCGLGCIDLSATENGYPIYAKLGFKEKEQNYKDMRFIIQ